MILFIPIFIVAATLLVGGELQVGSIAHTGQAVSLLGAALLLATAAISPDWRTFPKCGVIQLAVACALFAALHEVCYSTVSFSGLHYASNTTGWGDSDVTSSILVNIARLWRRTLLAYALGGDLLLLHIRGKATARKFFPLISLCCAVIALATGIGFAAAGTRSLSRYPCWYNYGPIQIEIDIILMVVESVFCMAVLVTMAVKKPVDTAEAGESSRRWQSTDKLVDDLELTSFSSSSSSASPPSPPDSATIGVEEDTNPSGMSASLSSDSTRSIVDDEGGPPASHKLGVTGGYVYRAKVVLGVHLLSLLVQLLANRTALKAAQGGMIAKDDESSASDPLFAFVQILAIILVDGKGIVVGLA